MNLILMIALILPQAAPVMPNPQSRCLSVTRTLFLKERAAPGRFILNHLKGEVRISAAEDSRQIVVQARLRNPGPDDNEATIGLSLAAHDGIVSLGSRSNERIIDLDIQLPALWSLRLDHGEQGDIFVHGLEGEMELQSQSGNVFLESASGPVLAHTEEGNITATFIAIPPDTAMSLISVMGKVTVFLPTDGMARIRLRSRRGRIQSDFPTTKTASGWHEVLLGEGGSLIRMESVENQVILHRAKKNR